MSPFKLTVEQQAAINSLTGNLQIIACAGSGKTEVVSRRIAELIKNGGKAKSIVAFTFTEKAADELKSRIRQILETECPDKADLGDMYVGTIHSFCFEMLKELEPVFRGYDVLDDPKKFAFVSMPKRYYGSHLETLRSRDHLSKFGVISEFFKSYDLVRMENIDLKDVTDKDFVTCCERYESFLKEGRYLDFTGMIYRLVDLLETDPKARESLHKRIRHLVVDEYQDVDQLQEKLIKQISQKCESLCVVGDDDQCIYNWRGSTVENIIRFSKNYPNVTRKDISFNFRSTAKIINCAQNFIKNNKQRLPKVMQPLEKTNNPSEKDDIFYTHFANEEEEFQFVVDRINALLKTDFTDKNGAPFALSYGDFAILTRTRKEATKIVAFLDQAGISSVLEIGGGVFEKPEVQLALSCISYIFELPLEDREITVQDLLDGYIRVFVSRLIDGQQKYPKASLNTFLSDIKSIQNKVNQIKQKGKLDYLQSGLQPFFHEIMSAFGAEKFLFEEVYNYNLAILSRSIADYESVWKRMRASEVKYFLGFIGGYGSTAYADTSHNDPTLIDAVKVLTIHRAKGLEFPVVFVPGFIKENNPPHNEVFVDESLYDADRYMGDDEDERRVYYTALTRSMKYLFVTGSVQRRKVDGSDYVRQFKPHPFSGELARSAAFSDELSISRTRSGHPIRRLKSNLFPTTFTDINCYQRCGHDYLLRNIYGFEVTIPPAYGYGKNMHNILNIIYQRYMESKKIPEDGDVEEIFENHFYLRYATEKIEEGLKKGGTRVIKNYVNLNKQDFSKVLETEKRFELVQNDALITGQIDLLKKYDANGDLKEVEIIDFKTEKTSELPDKFYREDHELQIRLYAIACFRSLGLHPKKAHVHYLDGNTFHEVTVDQPALQEANEQINQTITNIVGKKFGNRPQTGCTKCDYSKICPKKIDPRMREFS